MCLSPAALAAEVGVLLAANENDVLGGTPTFFVVESELERLFVTVISGDMIWKPEENTMMYHVLDCLCIDKRHRTSPFCIALCTPPRVAMLPDRGVCRDKKVAATRLAFDNAAGLVELAIPRALHSVLG